MNPWEDPRVTAGLTRQLAERGRALAGGAGHVGWKVGFGAPASLELMQITAPLLGYLTRETLLDDGAEFDATGWVRGVVEFEVAVRMGADVAGGSSPAIAAAAVEALAPAIELADVTIPPAADRVADVLATDIFHTGLLLGEFDGSRAGLDISGLTGHITIDGAARPPVTELEAITGHYPSIVATVASTLAAHGERLSAGDVIITGAIVPPVPTGEGTEFAFRLGDGPAIRLRRR